MAIDNLQLGDAWLQDIRKHWDTIDLPQMMLERLHKLVLAQIDDEQKMRWMKIRNSFPPCKEEEGFPKGHVSGADLHAYLHKAT